MKAHKQLRTYGAIWGGFTKVLPQVVHGALDNERGFDMTLQGRLPSAVGRQLCLKKIFEFSPA